MAGQKSANKLKTEARRAAVSVLVLGGATQREISDRLGVALGTINRDIKILEQQWAAERQDIGVQFTVDLRRLDELIGAVWSAASRGHIPAVDTALKILDRRARMLGYDALDSELTRQMKERDAPGEMEALSDEALLQIAASVNR